MGNQLIQAKVVFVDEWKRFVSEPKLQHLRNGSILGDIRYPEVLVAKALSHNAKDF
jgi:hypothetical protein